MLSHIQRSIMIDLLCFMWESDTQGIIDTDWDGLTRALSVDSITIRSEILGMHGQGIFDVICGDCLHDVRSCSATCPTKSTQRVRIVSRRMSRLCLHRENKRKQQENRRVSERLRKEEKRKHDCSRVVTSMKPEEAKKLRSIKKYKDSAWRFVKPSAVHVTEYAQTLAFDLDGQAFVDYYDSKGWLVGKSAMRDWRAAVRTWKRHKSTQTQPPPNSFQEVPEWQKTK